MRTACSDAGTRSRGPSPTGRRDMAPGFFAKHGLNMRFALNRAHYGPVAAVLLGQGYVWTAGGVGRKTASLRLWDMKTFELQDELSMESLGETRFGSHLLCCRRCSCCRVSGLCKQCIC